MKTDNILDHLNFMEPKFNYLLVKLITLIENDNKSYLRRYRPEDRMKNLKSP